MATYISKVKIGEEEKTVHADYATEADHAETADSATSATSASQAGKLVNKLTVTDADGVEREYDGSTSVSITSIEEAGHAETVDALDHTLTVKTGDNVTRTFDGSADINLGTVANLDNTMHLPRAQTNIADLSWTEPDGTEKTYDGQLDAIIQKLNLLEAKVATLTVTGTETHNGAVTFNNTVTLSANKDFNGSGNVKVAGLDSSNETDPTDFFVGGVHDDGTTSSLQKIVKRPLSSIFNYIKEYIKVDKATKADFTPLAGRVQNYNGTSMADGPGELYFNRVPIDNSDHMFGGHLIRADAYTSSGKTYVTVRVTSVALISVLGTDDTEGYTEHNEVYVLNANTWYAFRTTSISNETVKLLAWLY